MDIYGYGVVGFYLAFVVALGVIFRRISRNTSDYFRAGGAMPWWLTGASAWIASFSAWTFTGAVGKVYDTGALALVLYYSSLPPLLLVFFYLCRRYRRMRVVSYMEAVRIRYGPVSEQVFTWLKVPLLLYQSALGLFAIGIFLAAVFGIPVDVIIILLGVVLTLVSFAGGASAVLASDFVQMFLIVTVTALITFLVLRQPDVGGMIGFWHKLPADTFNWGLQAKPVAVGVYAIALIMMNFFAYTNLEYSMMYLMVKDDRHARRMVLIPIVGTLIGPIIWFIPPIAAHMMHLDLHKLFPHLTHPSEGVFVAVAEHVLPQGMVAILICAMLGAALTYMDAGLNKNAGIFIRSFYRPVIRPHADEKHLLMVSKLCTLLFGALIIGLAELIRLLPSTGLFDLTNQLAAWLLVPLMIPMTWGLFIQRTPPWSGWSTVLVGFVSSMVVVRLFAVDPSWVWQLLHFQGRMNSEDLVDLKFFTSIGVNVVVCSAWFFGTALFYNQSPQWHRDSCERFFRNMGSPIDTTAEPPTPRGDIIYWTLGTLCVIWGGFVTLLMLIPNPMGGRYCFMFVGGVLAATGIALLLAARRIRLRIRTAVRAADNKHAGASR
jgi:SSS family solute:Na+ symporter